MATPASGCRGALADVRVLDLSRILAGPMCTLGLADLGAEVIKVESPDGDDSRGMKPPDAGGEAHFYLAFNRNKKSIAIDVRTADGQALIHALADRSDVLVENFRAGVMKRFGLEWEAMHARHPRLIYCSISGYGRTGLHVDRPGLDPVLQAESGMMAMSGEPGGDPMRHPLSIVDTFTALHATAAILAALHARLTTGRGQLVDLALLDCAVAMTGNAAAYYFTAGKEPPRTGNAHSTVVPTALFKTRTRPLYLACGTDRLFAQLCRTVLGRPELATDPRFATNGARAANREALFAILGEAFAAETCAHWLARTREAGLPAGAVRTIGEALESDEIAARGMVVEVDHPTAGRLRLLGSPYHLSDTPVVPPLAPPLHGQHTDLILRDVLGLDAESIARLRASRVVV